MTYRIEITEDQVPLFKAAGFQVLGGEGGRPKSNYRIKRSMSGRGFRVHERRLGEVYRALRDNLDTNKSWTIEELINEAQKIITSRRGSGTLSETSLRQYLYALAGKGALVAH